MDSQEFFFIKVPNVQLKNCAGGRDEMQAVQDCIVVLH